jgi:hypothetical protein
LVFTLKKVLFCCVFDNSRIRGGTVQWQNKKTWKKGCVRENESLSTLQLGCNPLGMATSWLLLSRSFLLPSSPFHPASDLPPQRHAVRQFEEFRVPTVDQAILRLWNCRYDVVPISSRYNLSSVSQLSYLHLLGQLECG